MKGEEKSEVEVVVKKGTRCPYLPLHRGWSEISSELLSTPCLQVLGNCRAIRSKPYNLRSSTPEKPFQIFWLAT